MKYLLPVLALLLFISWADAKPKELTLYTKEKVEVIDVRGTIKPNSLDAAAAKLHLLPDSTKVEVRINSYGGSLDTAILLAAELQRLDSTCVVYDEVASAAYLLLLSCRERFYESQAMLVPHWIIISWTKGAIYPADMMVVPYIGVLYNQGVWDGIGMSVTGMRLLDYQNFRNSTSMIPMQEVAARSPKLWIKPISTRGVK